MKAILSLAIALLPLMAGTAFAGIRLPPLDCIEVPEPGTLALLATGIATLAYMKFRRP